MSRLGLQFGTLEDSSQQHPYPEGSHNLLEQWSLGIKLQCENAVLIKNYRVLYTLKYSRPFIIGLQLLVQPLPDLFGKGIAVHGGRPFLTGLAKSLLCPIDLGWELTLRHRHH